MVLQTECYDQASVSPQEAAAALATTLFEETIIPEISPSLSLFSTPGLSFEETPDTTVSHDFDTYSPALSSCTNTFGDSFGRDFPIFAGKLDATQPQTSPLNGPLDFQAMQHAQYVEPAFFPSDFSFAPAKTEPIPDIFISPNDLELCNTNSRNDASLAYEAENHTASRPRIPSMARASSDSSVFAIPKLPRGRKRKSSVDVSSTTSAASSPAPQLTAEEEEEEKVKLRAKNTESAARSRMRKKLELAQAIQRAEELEEEVRIVKLQATERDEIAQRRIQALEHQLKLMTAALETGDKQILSTFAFH